MNTPTPQGLAVSLRGKTISEITDALAPVLNTRGLEGNDLKARLQFNATLVTKLRTDKVWPDRT